MVVVKIGDGLGNQMYNYVAGYSVAKADGEKLLLDTSEVDNSTFRTYGLDQFNIECTNRESFSNRSFFHKVYKRLRRNIKYDVIFERKDETNPLDMNIYRKRGLRPKYLHGYFQNLYYFNTCREDILRQFSAKASFSEEVAKLISQFENENMCSLHIRGGDIPPLRVEYYKNAIDMIKEDNPDVKFVMFSNVHELAENYRNQLGITESKCIWEYGKFTDIEELFLMKACTRHILSDSTFSRWGALLDEDAKAVYAPHTEDDDKIYMPEWNKVVY